MLSHYYDCWLYFVYSDIYVILYDHYVCSHIYECVCVCFMNVKKRLFIEYIYLYTYTYRKYKLLMVS